VAKKKQVITTVTITDDWDNKELAESDAVEVRFGWAGTTYEMDLSKTNADKLEKLLKPYVEKARRVGGGRGRPKGSGSTRPNTGSGRSPDQLAAIREWLKKNGYEVNDRGRIKGELIDLFDAAHK
jgi:hypothetical protein